MNLQANSKKCTTVGSHSQALLGQRKLNVPIIVFFSLIFSSHMISHKQTPGNTARACDSCIEKRARWYCSADDAFLCQSCDGSVHSANPLAQRHERVLIKTAAVPHDLMIVHAHRTKKSRESSPSSPGSWHNGFTKKPRTPRNGKTGRDRKASGRPLGYPLPLVPEVGGDDDTSNEEIDRDEFLLYRVPAYDPSFAADRCHSKEVDLIVNKEVHHLDNLLGFLPSDADLAEFAADVESLLGRGLDNESFGIEELGLIDCKVDTGDAECSLSCSRQAVVKLEEDGGIVDEARGGEIDISSDTFKLSFDCDSPDTCWDDEYKGVIELENTNDANKTRKMILRLDYEGVITAWASHGSPWTTGDRPEFSPNDCHRDWMGLCGSESQNSHFGEGSLYGGEHAGIVDAGREAKVSRYREKRRTRLFSKKIRYEVRKLNAEKRLRMKGRFVKRTSFAPPPLPLITK